MALAGYGNATGVNPDQILADAGFASPTGPALTSIPAADVAATGMGGFGNFNVLPQFQGGGYYTGNQMLGNLGGFGLFGGLGGAPASGIAPPAGFATPGDPLGQNSAYNQPATPGTAPGALPSDSPPQFTQLWNQYGTPADARDQQGDGDGTPAGPTSTPGGTSGQGGGQTGGQTLDDIIKDWRAKGQVLPASEQGGTPADPAAKQGAKPQPVSNLPAIQQGGGNPPAPGSQPGSFAAPPPGYAGPEQLQLGPPLSQNAPGTAQGGPQGGFNPQAAPGANAPLINALAGGAGGALGQILANALGMRGLMPRNQLPFGMRGRPPWMQQGRRMPRWMRGMGARGPMAPGMPGWNGQQAPSAQQGTRPGVPPGAPGGPSPRPAAQQGPTSPPGIPTQGLTQGVKHFEGFTARARPDGSQWSNGYGTRARWPGEVIDRNEADRRLKIELGSASRHVDGIVPSNTPQNVRDALTSFTFNCGTGWMRGSSLADAVRRGNWRAASQAMQQYVRSQGQVLPGLVARRRAEAEFMLMNPNQARGAAPTSGSSNQPGSDTTDFGSDNQSTPTPENSPQDVISL